MTANNDKPKTAEALLEEVAQAVRLTTLSTVITDLREQLAQLQISRRVEKAKPVPDVATTEALKEAVKHAEATVGMLGNLRAKLSIEFVNALGLKAGPSSPIIMPKRGPIHG